jgi:hypothetical protein
MTDSATAGVHACEICSAPAVVFRFDGRTASPLCARHLLFSDPPAEEARLAPPPHSPDIPTFLGNDSAP